MLENYSKKCKLYYFTKYIIIRIICLFSFINAHHGKDYFVVTSYDTPHKGELLASLSIDNITGESHHNESENHSDIDKNDFSLEPGIIFGIRNNWTLEMHAHNSISNGVFITESIAFESLIRIIDENSDHTHSNGFALPFSIAMLLEYGIGVNETPDDLEFRFIIGKNLRLFSFVINLIAQNTHEEHEHFQYGLAFGLKSYLSKKIGGTLEFDMKLAENSEIHITPGINYSLMENFDFRSGTSININSENSKLNFRSMIIYSF